MNATVFVCIGNCEMKKITICWIRNTSKIDRSTLKSVTQCRAIHWKKTPDSLTQYKTEPKLNFTSELYKNSLFSEWKKEETTQGPDSGTLSRFTFIVYLIIFFSFFSDGGCWLRYYRLYVYIPRGRIWVDTHAVNWFDED